MGVGLRRSQPYAGRQAGSPARGSALSLRSTCANVEEVPKLRSIRNRSIKHPNTLPVLLAFAAAVLLPAAAHSDGMIFPRPEVPTQIFSVKYHHVDIAIDGQGAVTSVDQVFHNDSPRDQEGTYIFPLVEGATFNRFSMYVGDKEIEGKILDKKEARQVYESIVRQRKDPALLEYIGRNTFRASVYPIPANGDKRVRLEYSEVLPKEGGLVRCVYPLSTERFSAKPLDNVRITVRLSAKVAISNIYSPTHEIDVKQKSPTEAVVEWKGSNIKPDRDLVLYYALSDSDLPMQVLAHHEPGEPGYFMLLASPKPDRAAKPLPKNVVFVLDRTGSMAGKKLDQAKAALNHCLASLDPRDRFNVIMFNENTTWLGEGLLPGNEGNIDEATKMVRQTDARGGTNIDRALRVAIEQYDGGGGRSYVVFLTDGMPTVGETGVDKILENVRKENSGRTRIFVFGVGYDVNAQFLDRLAQDSKADADYVRPEEDIEVKVTAFFDKVSDPLLTDVKLAVTGAGRGITEGRDKPKALGLPPTISDMYPSDPLPDMFKGGQLIVIGKYDGAGDVSFTLSGTAHGARRSYKETVTLAKAEQENDFIPRLWAARKIGYLLDEIRLHRSSELVEEVVRLSREFGIPTEFTSFLADEREMEGGAVPLTAAVPRAEEALKSALAADTGSWSVTQSSNARSLRNQSTVPGAAQRQVYVGNSLGGPTGAGGFGGYAGSGFGTTNTYLDQKGNAVVVNTIQNVGTRTFYRQGNQWVDARYQSQRLYKVRQFSDAHFQLLAADPELRKYSTLGEVTVVINGNAVQIAGEGQEKLTPAELKAITGRA